MKKKRILGIVTAMLMVIVLALMGCGQKSEQNAGAAGFEYGNGASVSEPSKESIDEPVVDDEPVMDIGEKPDGSDVIELMHWYQDRDAAYIKTVEKNSDGYYHYKVGDKELLCKTNVWDFIDAKEGLRGTYYSCDLRYSSHLRQVYIRRYLLSLHGIDMASVPLVKYWSFIGRVVIDDLCKII